MNTIKNITEEVLWNHISAIEETVLHAVANGKTEASYFGYDYTAFTGVSVFNNKSILDSVLNALKESNYNAEVSVSECGDKVILINWNKNG